jgi:tetratricopeptide (TPR) repeat protein
MDTLGLIRASAACVALALSHLACAAVESKVPMQERGSVWFAPTLATDNHPICAAALEAERAAFFAPDDPVPDLPGLVSLMTDDGVLEDPDVVVLDKYPPEWQLTLPDRSQAFLYFYRYPGCRGSCERTAVGIHAERNVEDVFEGMPELVPQADRVGPNRWRLFKSAQGEFYLRGTPERHRQWYRVAAADRWELACDIVLQPDTSGGKGAAYSQKVSDALDSLRKAAGRIAGEGTECTREALQRWAQDREDGLETVLYRPWAVVERQDAGSRSVSNRGDYARVIQQLQLWSLGGMTEYRDFVEYQTQFARAVPIVADFYRARFKWTPARAQETAEAALKGAISRTFGSDGYDPFRAPGERELRQAILSRASIEKIRAIPVDPKAIDREGQDSVLNVALDYPQALSYLLEKGFNPNIGNAFGKTPLMYAAQHNLLAAAEILLKAGADPNATTHRLEDTCEYSINSSMLTPLQYAVRYSSARFIQLLVSSGAVTFIQSVRDDSRVYAIQDLERYTLGRVPVESNPHIAPSEVAALAELLYVPSNEQRFKMATELLERARSEYARGDVQQAYQHMRLALLVNPDLPEAIADLPVIALRAGYIGAAISAAHRATTTLTNRQALAASWFNKGLICEQPQAKDVYGIDSAHCEPDKVDPFVKSWKTQPSPARANKLRATIRKGVASCSVAKSGRDYRVALVNRFQPFRVYVLHRSSDTIDGSQIRWPISDSQGVAAEVVDSFSLGEDAVTVLEVPVEKGAAVPAQITLLIEGSECTPQW